MASKNNISVKSLNSDDEDNTSSEELLTEPVEIKRKRKKKKIKFFYIRTKEKDIIAIKKKLLESNMIEYFANIMEHNEEGKSKTKPWPLVIISTEHMNFIKNYLEIFEENMTDFTNPKGNTDEEKMGIKIPIQRGFYEKYINKKVRKLIDDFGNKNTNSEKEKLFKIRKLIETAMYFSMPGLLVTLHYYFANETASCHPKARARKWNLHNLTPSVDKKNEETKD